MLKPSVVYESPNAKRNFVLPHVSLAETADAVDNRAAAFPNSIFVQHSAE